MNYKVDVPELFFVATFNCQNDSKEVLMSTLSLDYTATLTTAIQLAQQGIQGDVYWVVNAKGNQISDTYNGLGEW